MIAHSDLRDRMRDRLQSASQIPKGNLRLFLMMDSLKTGGSERQFALMARAFRQDTVTLNLGCIHREGKFLEGLEEIEEYPTEGSFFSRKSIHSLARLFGFLRKSCTEVAHSFDFYTNLMMIPVARIAGVPVVIGSQRQLGDLLPPLKRSAQNAVFHLADCTVCNSAAAAKQLISEGVPSRKLAVIPNGLPPEAFQAVVPALPPEPGVVRVGMIARMNEKAKNHALFLRAVARIADQFSQAQFVLVGDGPFRKEWETLSCQLGIGSRTRFLGDRSDIPSVMAALDIVVSPSRTESLSNALLEAMASARPVVATRVGGNLELVRERETGLLVAPEDEVALAEAITILLAAPSLAQEWGQNAKRIALMNFTLDRARQQLKELYLALLAKKRHRQTLSGKREANHSAEPG